VRLRQNAADLMARLEAAAHADHACPDEKTVHRLRTGTRRCGALLESLLHHPPARGRANILPHQEKPARKLMRQWKKLRRAAGAVRDLDVHLQLLQQLRNPLSARVPQATEPALTEQLDHLQAWLAEGRQSRAAVLHRQAQKRLPRYRQLTADVLGELTPSLPDAKPAAASRSRSRSPRPSLLALEDFYRVSVVNALLNRDNLHDFRKSTKEARYVAEAGGEEPHAQAVSRALKKIQDTIGDWHDLDALCLEAQQALAGEGNELRDLLHDCAEAKLQEAIIATERMRRRLLGERLAMQPSRSRPAEHSQA
jgi:CHAD domain-containing protein